MKIEAKSRLSAATTLECGCISAKVCAHSVSALTEKQKKLDINKDGKISSDDLKKVREGEIAEATVVKAAPIPSERRIAFMKELFGRLTKKFPSLRLYSASITGSLDPKQFASLTKEMAQLGWIVKTKVKRYDGLMRKDKTWPLICDLDGGEVMIELGYGDTHDKGTIQKDFAAYKQVVLGLCKILGVKTPRVMKIPGEEGYSVRVVSDLDLRAASNLMQKAGYGKPKVFKDLLVFKKDHGEIQLGFNTSGNLDNVSCGA